MHDTHHAIRLNAKTFPLTPEEREIYREAGFALTEAESPDLELFSLHPETEALCVVSAKINSTMIDHLPNLRVISRFGSGTDNIDEAAAASRGIRITNIPEFCLSEVADHTMALLLASARKLLVMDRATRTGQWLARVQEKMHRIEGRQLGLVGFGRIAQEVAKRAIPFGLRVVVADPQLDREAASRIGAEPIGLNELLASSHFVSLHVPLTPGTRHMLGKSQFEMMRPDAILINTARGAVVDEGALVAALQQQRIAGAALDVFEGLDMFGPDPKPVDHPLFHLPNVVLSPHAAACSEESLSSLMRRGAQNAVNAVLEGSGLDYDRRITQR
jgi:D-3-phosphoglycerate dehydrogenase